MTLLLFLLSLLAGTHGTDRGSTAPTNYQMSGPIVETGTGI